MSSQKLKIGIITSADPNDKRSWSGTYYKMQNALKNEFSTVISLGPVELTGFQTYSMNFKIKVCSIFHQIIFKKKYNRNHNNIKSKYHGRFFEKQINKYSPDILFAPSANVQIAHLKTKVPLCYYCDTTVSLMVDYYKSSDDFSKKSLMISNSIEQLAIENSATNVFPSLWACESAKKDYGSRQTFLVKMGANIDEDPKSEDLVRSYDNEINILFVGVDWDRKGGPIILETLELLNSKGYNISLTVVGCNPPKSHPKMKVIPFLDKNKEKDSKKLDQIYKKAHLFFMPTRAECYGIVFCEANAYGLPVIGTDTGGVSSVIENGINGYILPINANCTDYFKLIAALIDDSKRFESLAITSRNKYLKELNWDKWGVKMKDILLKTKLNTKK